MTENATTNEPIVPNEVPNEPTPEIRQPDGTRRPANATEARILRERGVKPPTVPEPKDQQALDEIREKDDAARAKEDAAREEQQQDQATTELSVPEETPTQQREMVSSFMEQIAPIARELSLPVGDVQDVVDLAVSLAVTDKSGVSLEDPQACVTVLQSKYGSEEAGAIIKDAQAAVEKLGPKMREFLDSTMLGNDPSVLFALAAFKRGDLKMSPAKAQAELEKLTKDPRGAYRNADAPGHKSAVARSNMLYRILAKAEGKAAGSTKKSEPAVKSAGAAKKDSLQRELNAAINAPEYRKSGPGHAAAVARVEALYREMYPEDRDAETAAE